MVLAMPGRVDLLLAGHAQLRGLVLPCEDALTVEECGERGLDGLADGLRRDAVLVVVLLLLLPPPLRLLDGSPSSSRSLSA